MRATLLLLAWLGATPQDTTPKAPEQERALAQKALETARTVVAQARDGGGSPEAEARLKEAEARFGEARYSEASQSANAAAKLASAPPPRPSTFSVEVAPDAGSTTVTVKSGPAVRVEAEGTVRPVSAGESITVEKGRPPPKPPPQSVALVAPRPRQPADGERLALKPVRDNLLGPVKLAWAAVQGAERYLVEVVDEARGSTVFSQALAATELKLPEPLPEGRYRWTVRALGQAGRTGPLSPSLRFELVEDGLKLDVKSGQWQ